MTPEEFKDGLQKLGWKQSDFCLAVSVSKVTVSNWCNGVVPLPAWAQRYLELLLDLQSMAARLLDPPTRAARTAKRLEKQARNLNS